MALLLIKHFSSCGFPSLSPLVFSAYFPLTHIPSSGWEGHWHGCPKKVKSIKENICHLSLPMKCSQCIWWEVRISQTDHESVHLHLQTRLIVPAGRRLAQPLATVQEELKEISLDVRSCPSQREMSTSPCLQADWNNAIHEDGHTEKQLTLGTLFLQAMSKASISLGKFLKTLYVIRI